MAGQQEPADDKVYCVRCGAENRAIALYCESCGQLLGDTPTSAREWSLGGTRVETGPFQPKGLADLVTETFEIYKGSFRSFFTLSLMPLMPGIALSAFSALVSGELAMRGFFLFSLLVSTELGSFFQGALAYGVSANYLGRPVLVGECFGRAWNRAVSLLVGGFVMFVLVAPAWLSFDLVGSKVPAITLVLAGVLAYLLVRWFFFPQAIIVEGQRAAGSLRRSAQLVAGDRWRVFGVGVVFLLVFLAVSLLLSIPGLIIGLASPLLGDILLTTAGVVASPVLGIGATVVYFDLRARKEGFDLARLQEEMGEGEAERGFA